MNARLRRWGLGVVGVLIFATLWESYKAFGRAVGDHVFGWRLPAHTDDASMPHISTILGSFSKAEVRGRPGSVGAAVLSGSWFTLRLAVTGLIVGFLVGMALAIVMCRFTLVRRAWLPYVVLSQTVPLIALAPLIVGWGNRLEVGGVHWQPWMSVTGMSAYLAFFPIAVGALRGLQSPKEQSLELMDSYAASWTQTLVKLRLPAALPYILPAVKLGAAAAVVGAIVAELSAGVSGGVGRLILDYFQKATGDPARVFTAFIGAAILGLVVAAGVNGLEMVLTRHRPMAATS